MKTRTTRKREVEERKRMTGVNQEEANVRKEFRKRMNEKMFDFLDKSIGDEIKEIEMYGPYSKIPEFVNPWDVVDKHNVSNDIAVIMAALED